MYLVSSFIFMKSSKTKLNDQNQNLQVCFRINHCYCTYFEICAIVLFCKTLSYILITNYVVAEPKDSVPFIQRLTIVLHSEPC